MITLFVIAGHSARSSDEVLKKTIRPVHSASTERTNPSAYMFESSDRGGSQIDSICSRVSTARKAVEYCEDLNRENSPDSPCRSFLLWPRGADRSIALMYPQHRRTLRMRSSESVASACRASGSP